eukprot:s5226_g1.t1
MVGLDGSDFQTVCRVQDFVSFCSHFPGSVAQAKLILKARQQRQFSPARVSPMSTEKFEYVAGKHEKSQAIHLLVNASRAVELAKPIPCILEVWWAAPDALYQELARAGLHWSLEEVIKRDLESTEVIHKRPGGTLIVQLRGIFPEDCREKLWRVDKSANATVYERQMWALLGLNHAVRVQPIVELMTAAPVGMADRWAIHWQENQRESAPNRVEEKKPRRSPSKARRKRLGKCWN